MSTKDAEADRKKPRFQISLRSLFLLTVSLAVGLTIGAGPLSDANDDAFEVEIADLDWHYALLAAASTLIAIGLLQEAHTLRRERATAGFTWAMEIIGRVGLALVLLTSLTIRLLVDRRFIILPDNEGGFFMYGDVMTTHVWWLALGITLTERLRAVRPLLEARRRPIISAATTIAAVALGGYLLIENSLVTYLVHLAVLGIDASHAAADQRYSSMGGADQTQLASLAAGASIAVVLAAVCLVRSIQPAMSGRVRSWSMLAMGLLLSAIAAAFCGWFYGWAMPAISPDLAQAGVTGTWFQFLGGAMLAVMAVTYGAYRVSRTSVGPQQLPRRARSDLNSLTTIMLLLAAAVIFFVQYIRAMMGYSFSGTSVAEAVAYTLVYPDTYFMIGITVVSIQLAWSAWRRKAAPVLTVQIIDGRLFAAALVVFTALTLVAIPTFMAASFAFWLGPWYRW